VAPGASFCKTKSTLPSPIVTFCDGKYPSINAKKMWFVLFTGEHCPSCKQVEPGWVELAEETDHEKFLGVGHIDCSIGNHKKKICDQEDIKHFPSMKMLFGSTKREYRGDQNGDAYKGWVQQMIHHFYVCPSGVFEHETTDAVVGLCAKRYPHGESMHDWLLIFYNHTGKEASMVEKVGNEVAIDLGNEVVKMVDKKEARNKDFHKGHVPTKQRDRLMQIQLKYKMTLNFPDKGPFEKGPLAKVAGICCDCDDDFPDFCNEVLEESLEYPVMAWNSKGDITEARSFKSKDEFMGFALEKTGFVSGGDVKTEL